eukprot:2647489-Rhodomonas_salina.5
MTAERRRTSAIIIRRAIPRSCSSCQPAVSPAHDQACSLARKRPINTRATRPSHPDSSDTTLPTKSLKPNNSNQPGRLRPGLSRRAA